MIDPDERARLRQFLLEFCQRLECPNPATGVETGEEEQSGIEQAVIENALLDRPINCVVLADCIYQLPCNCLTSPESENSN